MTKTCRLDKNKAVIDEREPRMVPTAPSGYVSRIDLAHRLSKYAARLALAIHNGMPLFRLCLRQQTSKSEPVVAQLGRIVGSSLSTPSLDYVPAWAASLSCAARRCVRGWRRSYPGVVLDVLLELGDELGGEGAPRLADGLQDVARGHLLLAALE